MLPAQRKKIDISMLTEQEQQLFTKYGALPTHKSVLRKMQKDQHRKFFDSGDYALSKAGVAPQNTVGTAIPNPENIPHASSGNAHSNGHQSLSISPTNTSPVNKESGLAHDASDTSDDPMPANETTSDVPTPPHEPVTDDPMPANETTSDDPTPPHEPVTTAESVITTE